jgi:hypothetical protein
MEIRIESINMNVMTSQDNERDIAQEVRHCVVQAMERLLEEEVDIKSASDVPVFLDLRSIDWDAATDKSGLIARLILEAL